jgi:glycosyltransferase involved in cell wall biosynthesis
MFFSIVIPSYNSSHLISETLDSVRRQTFRDYEVLVTNDGSTDNTEAVLEEYGRMWPDFPLKVIAQTNKGIGGARNSGVFRAIGDFIAFLDADDHWYPEKLQRVKEIIDTNYGIDIVCHDEMEVRGDGKRVRSRYGSVRNPAYEFLLFKTNSLSTSATVVKRLLAIDAGGFSEDPTFNSAEDYEFWLRLAKIGAKFEYLPEVLGEYRRVEGSITQQNEYHLRNIFNVVEHHLDQLRSEDKYLPKTIDRIHMRKKAEHLASLARVYAKTGNRWLALRTHCQAISIYPFSLKCIIKGMLTIVGF